MNVLLTVFITEILTLNTAGIHIVLLPFCNAVTLLHMQKVC